MIKYFQNFQDTKKCPVFFYRLEHPTETFWSTKCYGSVNNRSGCVFGRCIRASRKGSCAMNGRRGASGRTCLPTHSVKFRCSQIAAGRWVTCHGRLDQKNMILSPLLSSKNSECKSGQRCGHRKKVSTRKYFLQCCNGWCRAMMATGPVFAMMDSRSRRSIHAFGTQTEKENFVHRSSFRTRLDGRSAKFRSWSDFNSNGDGHSKSSEEEDRRV